MLRYLFPRLTTRDASDLFGTVTAAARQPHWYREGGVPDTIDGRFAMLATIAALVLVRLERAGEAGEVAAVALTEQFIGAMDAEHRELGINDPTLGKVVRKLVGSLSRRVDLWRSAVGGQGPWTGAVRDSIYREADASPAAIVFSEAQLRAYWSALDRASDESVIAGRFA